MYTLEDDQETSSTLRKRDFIKAAKGTGAGGEAGAGAAMDAGTTGQKQHSFPLPLPPAQQITNQFKKITTPGKANAGRRHVALAALTVACICVFFTALDQTVVVTALPQIVTDLQIPFTQLDHAAWIVSAYLLGFIIAMPLMGRVSDIYGRRRIFLLCLSIFGIGSLFCGLAPLLAQVSDLSFLGTLGIDTSTPGLMWLIGARFFQAMGGGAIVPVAMAVAGDFYGEERRGLALGIIGAVTEAGGVLGPLYGAVVVEHLGWQYIFYLNVPIVIGLFAAAWFLIPRGSRLREGIDWLGAVLLGLALTCLSLGLAQQGTDLGPVNANSAQPQNNPIALALAAVFLIAFVLVERKVRWPVVDLSLFKRLPFSATSLVSLCVGAALIIAMADIPIFVDTVLQRSVMDSGLALMRMTVMIPIGALLGGWLCGRITCRFTAVIGLLFTAVGFYLMSRWPIDVNWTQITISTVTAGMGFGLVIAPIGTTAINAVRSTQAGTASAVVTALRMLGMTLGLAALTSWALAYFKQRGLLHGNDPLPAGHYPRRFPVGPQTGGRGAGIAGRRSCSRYANLAHSGDRARAATGDTWHRRTGHDNHHPRRRCATGTAPAAARCPADAARPTTCAANGQRRQGQRAQCEKSPSPPGRADQSRRHPAAGWRRRLRGPCLANAHHRLPDLKFERARFDRRN